MCGWSIGHCVLFPHVIVFQKYVFVETQHCQLYPNIKLKNKINATNTTLLINYTPVYKKNYAFCVHIYTDSYQKDTQDTGDGGS